jgi:signal transduction histidine kinase
MKGTGWGKLRVVVSDRGPGFDPAKLDRQGIQLGGLGLFNIRERMASFGGRFRIDSAPGRGTRITLAAPRD